MVDDLVPLPIEGSDPLVDRRSFRGSVGQHTFREPRDAEQVVELRVGKLGEQICEELASLLLNDRIVQGPRLRLRQVGDAPLWIFPDVHV